MNTSPSSSRYPWLMLFSRWMFFGLFQALIAIILHLSGNSNAWGESARWWMMSATGANIASILLLVWLFKSEGKGYRDSLHFERGHFWNDLLLALGGFILAGPIAMIPMNLLGNLVVGSHNDAVAMMFRPLPGWALWIGLLFPLTIAFAELPTYFGYVMPRLEQITGNGWLAWAIASFFLSIQHTTLPLIFNGQFILWRALMYLPFAFYIGLVIKLRPRLLPYLMVGHALIDLATWSVYLTLK